MNDIKKTRPQRAIVTGVTIDVMYPDGNSRTFTIDPKRTEAIFWSEQSVIKILSKFYATERKVVSKKRMVDSIGKHKADRILANQSKITLSPDVVIKMWNEEDEFGILPPYLSKSSDCVPG